MDKKILAENIKNWNFDSLCSISSVIETLQELRKEMEKVLQPTWFEEHKDMLSQINELIYEALDVKKSFNNSITKYEENN